MAAVLLRAPEIGVLAVGCLTAIVAGAALMTRRAHLEVDIEVVPARVARGEPAVASVTVGNAGRRASRSARLVVPYGDRDARVVLRTLPAGSRRTIGVPLPTDRRGVLRIGPVGLLTTDPLGLFSRYESLGGHAQLPVHPAAVPLAPLPSARSSSPDGLPVDSRVEGGVTFHALREYAPGDDLRHVHWRSSARAGTLLVRRHVDPSEPVTTVVLDTRRRAYLDGGADDGAEHGAHAFDTAVDAAASVVLASARSRFPVRLHTTDGLRLVCRDHRNGDTAVLDALAGAEWADADARTETDDGPHRTSGGGFAGADLVPSDRLAEAARDRSRRGVGSLVIVTGPRDVGQVASVGTLAGQFEQVVVLRVGGATGAWAGPGPDEANRGEAPHEFAAAARGRLRVLEIADITQLASVWSRVVGAHPAAVKAVPTGVSSNGTGRLV